MNVLHPNIPTSQHPNIPYYRAVIRRAGMVIVALVAVAYCWLFLTHIDYAVGGSDSSAYMNEARVLASGRMWVKVTPLETLELDSSFTRLFVPLGFKSKNNGYIVPYYPPGTAVHFAAAGLIGGWSRAPYFVVPLFSLAALAMLFLTGRELGLSTWMSIAAAALLAASAVFIHSGLQPTSDGLAEWAEPQLPKRALVISGIYTGAFFYYADRWTVRWDGMDSDTFQLMRAYAFNANMP